jgi:hypothetical protein
MLHRTSSSLPTSKITDNNAGTGPSTNKSTSTSTNSRIGSRIIQMKLVVLMSVIFVILSIPWMYSYSTATRFGFKNQETEVMALTPAATPTTTRTTTPIIITTLTPCLPVYFWGGGKAGSTTLAVLLNNAGFGLKNETNFHRSPFIEIGKEPCWASGTQNSKWNKIKWDQFIEGKCNVDSSMEQWQGKRQGQQVQVQGQENYEEKVQKKFVMDGCPRYTNLHEAKKIIDDTPDAPFLMLVRDPTDRLVSELNDSIRRQGAKFDVEIYAKSLLQKLTNPTSTTTRKTASGSALISRSMYGRNLQTLLSVIPDPNKILIIRMDNAFNETNVQETFDVINDHIGSHRRKVNKVTHANSGHTTSKKKSEYVYSTLSDSTRKGYEDFFRSDVDLLERLVGRKLPWSTSQISADVDANVDTDADIDNDTHTNSSDNNGDNGLVLGDSSWFITHPAPL